jgi:hypothetical protein
VAHVNPALVQKVFDIAQRKWKPHIHHHRKADDFRRRFEIAERFGFGHSGRLGRRYTRLKKLSSDSTHPTHHFPDAFVAT